MFEIGQTVRIVRDNLVPGNRTWLGKVGVVDELITGVGETVVVVEIPMTELPTNCKDCKVDFLESELDAVDEAGGNDADARCPS